MSININLVDKRSPQESKSEKLKKLKGISFGVLFLTALLSILIFVIDFRFSASFVRKQQADLMEELEPYNETTSKIFILNSKLSDASAIITARKKYNKLASEILKSSPESLSIDEFMISEAGVTMTITSTSLLPIDEFLNSTLKLLKNKTISNVTLKDLSLEINTYTVELLII